MHLFLVLQPITQFVDRKKPMELNANHIACAPFNGRANRTLWVQAYENIAVQFYFDITLKLGASLGEIE